MFPGTTLFGVLLILIIAVSLIILLIRKPHIPLPFSSEEKSRKSKERAQTVPKPCPHYLGYLSNFPENTPTPQECGGCTKIMKCQVGLDTLRTLPRREEKPEKPKPIVQAAERPKEPSESVEFLQVTKEERVPTPSGHPQLRPPELPRTEETPEKPTPIVQAAEGPEEPSESVEFPQITEEKLLPKPSGSRQLRPADCIHFFGYLRKIPKGIPIPDECFGCPKMVDCLYYDVASE